jgi:hypothetical protein
MNNILLTKKRSEECMAHSSLALDKDAMGCAAGYVGRHLIYEAGEI